MELAFGFDLHGRSIKRLVLTFKHFVAHDLERKKWEAGLAGAKMK
jgi:hypothetical protein